MPVSMDTNTAIGIHTLACLHMAAGPGPGTIAAAHMDINLMAMADTGSTAMACIDNLQHRCARNTGTMIHKDFPGGLIDLPFVQQRMPAMKKMLSLAAVALLLSGCAVYQDGYYDDGYKKPHPHGCPPGQAKKGNC